MRTYILGGFAALAFAGNALADCNTPIVTMKKGQAPQYHVPGDAELADAVKTHGDPGFGDKVLLIDEADGAGYWIDRAGIEDAAFLLGADPNGFRYSGPDHCAPKDLPVNLDEIPEKSPVPVIAPNGIPQPKTGTWRLEMGQPQVQECPPMMRQSISVPPDPALASEMGPRHLQIVEPFHPDQLEMTRKMNVRWKKIGPASWQTEAMRDVFANLPQDAGQGSSLVWQLTTLSPNKMEHLVRLTIALPAEAAAALGGDRCVMETVSHWLRIAD